MYKVLAVLLVSIVACLPLMARDAAIVGDYVEVRTSDVYTGPCVANAEVNLVGKEAILAWKVREGSWQGVPLQGLSVVAVIGTDATLGDPYTRPERTQAVIVVDEKASADQRDALVRFARDMAPALLQEVVRIETAPIQADFQVNAQAHHHHHGGELVSLKAGDVAEIKARAMKHTDHLCGNEEVFYPPLTEVAQALPAYTLVHQFRGTGLDRTWSSPGKRSTFVGVFAR